MSRGRRTVQGTSYRQREDLRALARAVTRNGGPVPSRKVFGMSATSVDSRLWALHDKGMVDVTDGDLVTMKTVTGVRESYRERVYAPSDAGRDLLALTDGEPVPELKALSAEQVELLSVLVVMTDERGSREGWSARPAGFTAAHIASRLHRDEPAAARSRRSGKADPRTLSVARRLSALCARRLVWDDPGNDMYATRRYGITPDGRDAVPRDV